MQAEIIRSEVIDREAILQRFSGDISALKCSAEAFFRSCPDQLREIHSAIAEGNSRSLEHAAYRLGWSLSTFSPPAALDTVLILEQMGRTQNMDIARVVYRRLEVAIENLRSSLDTFTLEG